MDVKNYMDLVGWCYNKLGTPYVYGTKGAKLTKEHISWLAKEYPSTFSADYIAKSNKFVGQHTTDCSGLISWFTGVVRGSSQYYSSAVKRYDISQLKDSMVGHALWKPGHIGIYIGVNHCIEAKGINFGTVKTAVSSTNWTHVLQLCDIDYSKSEESTKAAGWINDNNGWRYSGGDGCGYLTGWQNINNVWYYFNVDNGYMVSSDWIKTNENWYYLNENGSLYYGWLYYKSKWYYLDKDGTPEGAMVTGLHLLPWNDGKYLFNFNSDGEMVTGDLELTTNEIGALVIK